MKISKPLKTKTHKQCIDQCDKTPNCVSWTWNRKKKKCYLTMEFDSTKRTPWISGNCAGSARRCGSNIVNYVHGIIENQEFSMDNMHCDPTSGEKYWLTPSQYTGEAFVAELESTIPVIGVRLRNTHKLQDKDRATKKFRVSIGSSNEGPWTELLTQELEDSRNQEVPPLQHFESNNAISGRFLQFELLEFWGDGGGLNYFDIIQEVTVGSPISFIENGEEHKQNMTITKLGGKHILTVTIPAHGIFKATTVLITEDTNKGNSKSEDNMIFIAGNHSSIMKLPSDMQALHEIFDAAHNYNGTLRRSMETEEHAFLVHEGSLSVEEVEALDPAIRSFVQTGSVSRVTSRKVTEDHFKGLNNGTVVTIPPPTSNYRQSDTSYEYSDPYVRCRCKKDEVEFANNAYSHCLRLIDTSTDTVIASHDIYSTITDHSVVNCCILVSSDYGNEGICLNACCGSNSHIEVRDLCVCGGDNIGLYTSNGGLLRQCGCVKTTDAEGDPVCNGDHCDGERRPAQCDAK